MPEKEKSSTNADIDVALSLRAGLLVLGFEDADVARSSTTLTKIIRRTITIGPEPNQPVCQRLANNKQLHTDQAVLRSSDQCSIITAPAENSAVFHLESPSDLVRKSKKRKRKNLEENGRPTTSDVESNTSWKRPIPKPRHAGVTAQAEGQHFSNAPSHLKHQDGIMPCFQEGRNMQRVDTMDLYAPALCQNDVVEACENPREAVLGERPRTESGELVRVLCSWPVANAIIAEHSQTPVIIPNDVDANDHNSPAPQLSRQDGPEHSRSPSLLSPTAESTSHSLPPCKSVCTSLASTL
jgi:hypothetical protein